MASAVGTSDEPTFVMKVGDRPLYVDLDKTGFLESGLSFVYTSNNCSGQRLFLTNTGNMIGTSAIVSGMLFFAVEPVAQVAVGSVETYAAGANLSLRGACSRPSFPWTGFAGSASGVELSTFGVTPPFHVE